MIKRIRPGTHVAEKLILLLQNQCSDLKAVIPENPILIKPGAEIYPNVIVNRDNDPVPLFIADIDIQSCGRNEDHSKKLRLYEELGIPEHWLIFPADRIIVKRTSDSFRKPKIFEPGETITLSCCNSLLSVLDILK
jgi:Uma2 family endonuclease